MKMRIAIRRPLLVLCALGFLGMSSGLVAARELGHNRLSVDFDAAKPGKDGKARTIDRRQPLPSTNAARYIQGGTGAFATNKRRK